MKDLTLDDYLKEQLKNPEFRHEWQKSEAAYQVTKLLLKLVLKTKSLKESWLRKLAPLKL
jgi:hypothetical protein